MHQDGHKNHYFLPLNLILNKLKKIRKSIYQQRSQQGDRLERYMICRLNFENGYMTYKHMS